MSDSDEYIKYESKVGLLTSKELLYQKVDTKIELFEMCLNHVGLYRSFPYLDLTKNIVLKHIMPEWMKLHPIDIKEEELMRRCVRRNIDRISKTSQYLIQNDII